MSKKTAIFLLVIALAGGGYYYYCTQLSCSFLNKSKMKVAGKEEDCWPKEARKKAGWELRRIPDGKNAAVLYVQASNALKKKGGASESRWVEQNAQCLKLVHKAVRKPNCEFPIFGSDHDCAYGLAMPMMAPMRDFARLLVFEGDRYEHRGEYGKALECYFAMTPLSGHVRESNAVFVIHLVAVALQTMRDRAVEECLSSNRLGADELRKAVEHYEHAVQGCASFAEALRVEKQALDSTVAEMIRRPEVAQKMLSLIGGGSDADFRGIARVIGAYGADLRRDLDHSFELLVQWSREPSWVALRPDRHFAGYLSRLPDTSLLSKMLLPALAKARKSFARGRAHTHGILIFAAIKLYEKKNGRPPASLAELKADCLSELPKDPFSGRDYVYKVRGNDWILYSVWDNLTDDGGVGSWPHKTNEDKDLIWRNTRIASN